MLSIRSIDPIFNGIVTRNELDDILKISYPDQFSGKDLLPFIKTYRSIQNKILVDYRSMRDSILKGFLVTLKEPKIDESKV